SLMAHRVKVLPGKAIRMNDAVTTPYNADFDGDEMNIHIPQTLPAQIEAKMLLSVKNHLISSGDGSFIIQPKLDGISGIIFLTSKDTKVSKELAGKLLGCMNKLETINDSESNAISGKKIFSTILPPIDLECKSKMCKVCGTCEKEKCPYDAYVVIRKGELKCGTVDKESLKKILEEIYKKYGPEATVKFIDECSLLGLNFAHSYGLTIGVDEYFAHPEYEQKVEEILNEMNAEVKEIINAYLNGQMERLPGKTLDETREVSLLLKINSARIKAAKLLERYLKENNAAYKMVKGGVKGNELNLVQMMGLQGQVTVGGKRIERGFRGRALTFFKQNDYSPAARGFIKSSFRKGLNPIEYFMQAAGGRDSTIDKSLNTADSGYFYRRLANALLDIIAREDGLVTDSTNQVIQFKYGEDGVFPSKQIHLTG
ncbi:MAG: DNA-directed RNA polymerase subunit A', partial [archaeon]